MNIVQLLGIRAQVKTILINSKVMTSGVIGPETKLNLRSRSSRIFWLIQMSTEMWEYDAQSGVLLYEKMLHQFLRNLFRKWQASSSSHSVTIILFSRTFYQPSAFPSDFDPHASLFSDFHYDGHGPGCAHANYSQGYGPNIQVDLKNGRYFEDFYQVVVQDFKGTESWPKLLPKLKFEFARYVELHRWSLPTQFKPATYEIHENLKDKSSGRFRRTVQWKTFPTGTPARAFEGNVLEAINVTLNMLDKHFMDRDLYRSGQNIVMITAGYGVFQVDPNLARITKQRMMDNGIGMDMMSLATPPLHGVPLFIWNKHESNTSANNSPNPSHDAASAAKTTKKSNGNSSSSGSGGTGSAGAAYGSADFIKDHLSGLFVSNRQNEVFNIPHWINISFLDMDCECIQQNYSKQSMYGCTCLKRDTFKPLPSYRMFDMLAPDETYTYPLALKNILFKRNTRLNVSDRHQHDSDRDVNQYDSIRKTIKSATTNKAILEEKDENDTKISMASPSSSMNGDTDNGFEENETPKIRRASSPSQRLHSQSTSLRPLSSPTKELAIATSPIVEFQIQQKARPQPSDLLSSLNSIRRSNSSGDLSISNEQQAPLVQNPDSLEGTEHQNISTKDNSACKSRRKDAVEKSSKIYEDMLEYDRNVFHVPTFPCCDATNTPPMTSSINTNNNPTVASTPSSTSTIQNSTGKIFNRSSVHQHSQYYSASTNKTRATWNRLKENQNTGAGEKGNRVNEKIGKDNSNQFVVQQHHSHGRIRKGKKIIGADDSNRPDDAMLSAKLREEAELEHMERLDHHHHQNLHQGGSVGRGQPEQQPSQQQSSSLVRRGYNINPFQHPPKNDISPRRIVMSSSLSKSPSFSYINHIKQNGTASTTSNNLASTSPAHHHSPFSHSHDHHHPKCTNKHSSNPFQMFVTEWEYAQKLTSNRRRWTHLFPILSIENRVHHASPNWLSLTTPAILPLTTDFYPQPKDLHTLYSESFYTLTLALLGGESSSSTAHLSNINSSNPMTTTVRNHRDLVMEMVGQRLSQDFQLVETTGIEAKSSSAVKSTPAATVTAAMDISASKTITTLASTKHPRSATGKAVSTTSSTVSGTVVAAASGIITPQPERIIYHLSMGHRIHQIIYDEELQTIEVKRYVKRQTSNTITNMMMNSNSTSTSYHPHTTTTSRAAIGSGDRASTHSYQYSIWTPETNSFHPGRQVN